MVGVGATCGRPFDPVCTSILAVGRGAHTPPPFSFAEWVAACGDGCGMIPMVRAGDGLARPAS